MNEQTHKTIPGKFCEGNKIKWPGAGTICRSGVREALEEVTFEQSSSGSWDASNLKTQEEHFRQCKQQM